MVYPFSQDISATQQFLRLYDSSFVEDVAGEEDYLPMRAVVIGGGTGAPMSIRTLLALGVTTDAVVAMADDGGSTGILREEAHATPPGDVRKCLAAFAKDPDDPFVRAFKYRLTIARNHSLGNLMLAALEDTTHSFPEAIAVCERLLNAQGHVYPSTLTPVRLIAKTRDGALIDGQAPASHAKTALSKVKLVSDEPVLPYEPALQALRRADLIVLGPGSLFTSIIPNLLVPGIVDAIRASRGRVLFVCSLADVQGETWGLTVKEHVEALFAHGMEGLIDYVLVHVDEPLRPASVGNAFAAPFSAPADGLPREPLGAYGQRAAELPALEAVPASKARRVAITYQDMQAIQAQGPVVIARSLVDPERPTWHDPKALRDAFLGVIRLCHSRQM